VTTTDYAHTPYAEAARTRKAALLMDALYFAGCDAATAAVLDDEGWRNAERAAGLKRPASAETRRVVVNLMVNSVSERARLCPTCGIGNPDGPDAPAQPYGHGGACSR